MSKSKSKSIPKEAVDSEESTNTIIEDIKQEELTFDRFTYKDKTYYRDKFNGIWDSNAILVGAVIKINKDGEEKEHYEMFDRIVDTNKDIYKFLK